MRTWEVAYKHIELVDRDDELHVSMTASERGRSMYTSMHGAWLVGYVHLRLHEDVLYR
jgi:hypothetical protein